MATVEARITKVEHDVGTGWYSIYTDSDSVKKLTTKMDAKATEAAALRQSGEVVLIRYSHKQRTDDNTGRTYNNYYYEQAATASRQSNGASGSGIDSVGSAAGVSAGSNEGIEQVERPWRKMDPSEAWRICLGSGAKLAVQTLPLMPVEQRTFEVQKQIALAWALWIFSTPVEAASTDTSGRSAGAPGAYAEPDPGREYAPPPNDDDIPF